MRRLLEDGLPGASAGCRTCAIASASMQEQRRRQSRLGDALDELTDELDRDRRPRSGPSWRTRADEDARFREAVLASLPPDPAGQIRELQDYPFRSAEAAQRRSTSSLEGLRRQLLDAYLGQIAEGMQSMSEDDMTALRDMLADLNRMLEQRRTGVGPSAEEFADFMAVTVGSSPRIRRVSTSCWRRWRAARQR